MKVHAKYLAIGPRLSIGTTPVRKIHLIDPDREGTMCGRTPYYGNHLSRCRRWLPITVKDECTSTILECSICKRFVTQYAVDDRLDAYERFD